MAGSLMDDISETSPVSDGADYGGHSVQMSCLLIDDDPIDIRYVSWLLQQANGFDLKVQTASSLREARRLCTQQEFDLYLFDYWMGEDSSVSLLQELASRSGAPHMMVVMSSLDDESFQRLSLESGADFFLAKQNLSHLTLEKLLQRVFYAASKRRANTQHHLDEDQRTDAWMRSLRSQLDKVHGYSVLAMSSLHNHTREEAKSHLADAIACLSGIRNEMPYMNASLSNGHKRSEVVLSPFDVSQLLSSTVEACSLEAEQFSKRVSFYEQVEDSIILSDPMLLQDLLTITLRGAIRHGEMASDIAVSYELQPTNLEIFISEFGASEDAEVENYDYEGREVMQLSNLFGEERTGSFLVADHILKRLQGSWAMGRRDNNTEIKLRIPLNIDALN
ncbi:response regulator [Cohaesibacter intestini]|uniref:response regulator n=1 Tax=Cohaesibacter intestini TaxID=2211145 RepID=UPI000DEA21C8|nr:response regulator [Cohaesibacter intestini]